MQVNLDVPAAAVCAGADPQVVARCRLIVAGSGLDREFPGFSVLRKVSYAGFCLRLESARSSPSELSVRLADLNSSTAEAPAGLSLTIRSAARRKISSRGPWLISVT